MGLGAMGGFGFADGGGFGLPSEPPGAGEPAGPLLIACPRIFRLMALAIKALKKIFRIVFIIE